jgi:undecaprenyl-diphosphatase
MKKDKIGFWLGIGLLILFVLLTLGIKFIDVQPIGPQGSEIGFASVNGAAFNLFGQNALWDKLTDLISLVGFASLGLIGVLGLTQMIRGKSIRKMDRRIWILAAFYVAFAALFLLFEFVVINYRPILEEGVLEASFPSTHTMMVVWMLGSSAIYFNGVLKNKKWNIIINSSAAVLMALTAFGRLAAGVHWLTDVLGGLILGAALLLFYTVVDSKFKK